MRISLSHSIMILFFLGNCLLPEKEPGKPPKIQGIPIPDKDRSIYVQNFRNNSYGVGIHTRLTQLVKEEIDRRGRFLQTRDKNTASFRLYGEINHYQQVGNLLDQASNPISAEIFTVVKIELQKADTGEKIPMERDEIPGTVYYSEQVGFRETEDQAQNRLLRVMAIRIAEEIENGWYYSLLPR